jgi:hypothetical protein
VGLAESHLRVEYSCLSIYNEWLFQNLSTSLCSKETGQSERTDLNWCISCGGKERLAAWHSICFNSQMPTLSSAKFSEAKSGWKINVFSGPSNCTCQLHAETAAPKQHQATKICKELNSWPVGSKMLQNVVSPQKNALVYKCKLWHLLLPNAEKSTAEVCSNLDARILNWSWKSKDYIALFGNWMYPEMALNKQCSRASVVPFSWLVNSDSHSGQLMTLHNICTIYIIYNTHTIIYVYMYICIYVYMCICIYVYMYICISIYM